MQPEGLKHLKGSQVVFCHEWRALKAKEGSFSHVEDIWDVERVSLHEKHIERMFWYLHIYLSISHIDSEICF